MTATRKSIRFLTVITLVLAMVLSIVSIPVSAAGAENWYPSNDYISENAFTIRGYNLTPVKTCMATGYLNISMDTLEILDSSTNSNPINITLQIRDTSGNVLQGFTSSTADWKYGLPYYMWTACKISYGQQVQIYIGAYDAVTGVYRTVKVKYSHLITGH